MLCAACAERTADHPQRPPVALAEVLAVTVDSLLVSDRAERPVPDPRTVGGTACQACGGPASWHRTVRGRWMLVEPGAWPTHHIPVGKRWRIAGDGTAVNLGPSLPADTCRISHFDVCPSRPAPADSSVLLALWRQHTGRTGAI
ncbi:DUF6083 domain-containing protein [Yinghuangia aomiensis]